VKEQLEGLVLQMVRSGIRYGEAVRVFKKAFLTKVLVENQVNQCQAARMLGMHRNSLGRTLADLQINPRELRTQVRRPPRGERPPVPRRVVSGR
jgi:Fis family transcriptional regulator, factor for inversion stimulation protein